MYCGFGAPTLAPTLALGVSLSEAITWAYSCTFAQGRQNVTVQQAFTAFDFKFCAFSILMRSQVCMHMSQGKKHSAKHAQHHPLSPHKMTLAFFSAMVPRAHAPQNQGYMHALHPPPQHSHRPFL